VDDIATTITRTGVDDIATTITEEALGHSVPVEDIGHIARTVDDDEDHYITVYMRDRVALSIVPHLVTVSLSNQHDIDATAAKVWAIADAIVAARKKK
jgi:hypothetical protein